MEIEDYELPPSAHATQGMLILRCSALALLSWKLSVHSHCCSLY
jgi:hypothetical protein